MAAGGSVVSMGMRIRDAVPEDADSLVEIGSTVRLRPSLNTEQEKQGFLIDISLEQYSYFIVNDHVLVMEESDPRRLVGFSVILGPRTTEATGLRQKAEHIGGATLDVGALDLESCAYWEQIAFLPRYAKGLYPVYLGFTALRQAFRKYENLFGAVVSRPIPNLAPRRLLDSIGWRCIGWIDQDYPAHGRVRYDIYYLNRSEFEKRRQEPFVRRLAERLGGDP